MPGTFNSTPDRSILARLPAAKKRSHLQKFANRLPKSAPIMHAAESAPRPRTEVLEAARLQIAALAQRGKPDVDTISERGKIAWPQKQTHAEVTCRIADAVGGGISIGLQDDTLAILCWALKNQIDRALELLIADEIDGAGALTDQQRTAKLDQLAVDLLAAERTEVVIIETAISRGLSAKFRADTDPRAILHVC